MGTSQMIFHFQKMRLDTVLRKKIKQNQNKTPENLAESFLCLFRFLLILPPLEHNHYPDHKLVLQVFELSTDVITQHGCLQRPLRHG